MDNTSIAVNALFAKLLTSCYRYRSRVCVIWGCNACMQLQYHLRAYVRLIPYDVKFHVQFRIYKVLSCRRKAARRTVSLKLLLSKSLQDHAKLHRWVLSVFHIVAMPLSCTSNNDVPLKSVLLSFKVTENGTIQSIIDDFLSVCHCKYSSILYHFFRDNWR